MNEKIDYLETAVSLTEALESRGLKPILVGGMALVVLGSQRITNDFDFLISFQESAISDLVDIFYEFGFELVSKLNEQGEVTRTINNKNIAVIRLKLDLPPSAFFFHPKKELKIDLLFDFPLLAKEVASRATKIKIKSRSLRIASTKDLLHLKQIAYADRRSAADAQDLEFLHRLLKTGE